MNELDLDDEKESDDDLRDECDQCGKRPVVADVGGQDLCDNCFSEYE